MKRTDIILLFLKDKNNPIIGTTRFQKLLFLAEKEKHILAEDEDFEFEAYNYGPASKKLYSDLEFLLNIGFIKKSDENVELKNISIENIESMSAQEFLSDESLNSDATDDEYNEDNVVQEDDTIVYRITDQGVMYLKEQNLIDEPESEKIESIKNMYAKQPLQALLRYVYKNYENYTTESLIKDDIL